jgi:pilus assembly protein Flp/PilA
MKFINRLRSMVSDESGQDLLEYALLTALIALVAAGAIQLAGVEVNAIFGAITTALQGAA